MQRCSRAEIIVLKELKLLATIELDQARLLLLLLLLLRPVQLLEQVPRLIGPYRLVVAVKGLPGLGDGRGHGPQVLALPLPVVSSSSPRLRPLLLAAAVPARATLAPTPTTTAAAAAAAAATAAYEHLALLERGRQGLVIRQLRL